MKTTLFQRSALVALILIPSSSWAASKLWSSPVISPLPYNAEGALAPVEVAPPIPAPNVTLARNNMLVVKPTGESVTLYNTLLHRDDGSDAVAIGLQRRSAQGVLLAEHVEPYAGKSPLYLDQVPAGYQATYLALSPNGGAWVAAYENGGSAEACKILKFKPDFTKVSESNCSDDGDAYDAINQIVPLANNLAIVQAYDSFHETSSNYLINHLGVKKQFPQDLGTVVSWLRLGNGTTALITLDSFESGANSTAQVKVLNSNGVVLSSTPLLTPEGQPLESFEFDVKLLNSNQLLIVSRFVAANGWDFGGVGEVVFTAFDLQTHSTKWMRQINAPVDYDVKMGKVIALGLENQTSETPALFEISANGELRTSVLADAPDVLKRYVGFLSLLNILGLAQNNLYSNLTANLNGTITVNFSDMIVDENAEDPSRPPQFATTLTLDAKTGALLKTTAEPGSFYGFQRDAFNRVYALRTRPLMMSWPEQFFNVTDPGQTFIEKFDAR